MRTADFVASSVLASLIGLMAVTYLVRLAIKGRARNARTDREGSALLGRGFAEMAYWGLRPFGQAMLRAGITPNQITYASLLFGIGSGVAAAFGDFGIAAIVGTLSCFFDIFDGMVARWAGVSSDAGEVLDAAVDRYVEMFFLGGLTIYYRDRPVLMVLALAAMLGGFMITYSTAKAEAVGVDPPRGTMRRLERAVLQYVGAGFAGFTMPSLEASWGIRPAVGVTMVAALAIVAVLANVSAIRRFRAITARLRAPGAQAA